MGVEFAGMLGTKIVVRNESTGARSLFGVQPYSTGGSTYDAHVMEADNSNRKLSGIDESFSIVAWIDNQSTGDVTRASTFTFPDGTKPPVRSVTYPRDENGNVHHTKVVFG